MTNRPDPREPMHPDPGQVDPFLREGPVRRWGIWALGLAVALIVGFVFYVLMTPSPNAGRQSAATSAPPAPATSGSGSGQAGR